MGPTLIEAATMADHSVLCGEGRYRVWADLMEAGDDLLILIGGGECPHIGSVSLAEPGCSTKTISSPGHKERIVTTSASEMIAKATGKRCLVAAGIHIDNASKEEIALLLANSEACIRLLIQKVSGR